MAGHWCARPWPFRSDLLARFHRDVREKFAKTVITIYVDGKIRVAVFPRRNGRALVREALAVQIRPPRQVSPRRAREICKNRYYHLRRRKNSRCSFPQA